MQIVPTLYSDLRNSTISTNQYSVTEHFKESNVPMQHNLPGVFFYYDLSPIKVCHWYQECCRSHLHWTGLINSFFNCFFSSSLLIFPYRMISAMPWRKSFNAMQVAFSEEKSSFLSFLTSVCAIVGGVFTVSGILDSFVFHGSQVIRKKKVDLGKFS